MKKRRRYSTKSRVPSRRWHVPPPLIHGPETLEGGEILQEWGSGLGVILWQAFRDSVLWATSAPESRAETFVTVGRSETRGSPEVATEPDPRLEAGLRILQRIVTKPDSIREAQVARACRQLSEWADDKGRLETALAFAQSAALAVAQDAAAAFWVATIAVRLNDHARAEVWFRRAIGLARQSRDWRMYSRSFGGLGNLYIRRGNLPAARRLHTRALRGARRGGMRREQATALHDLFAVAVETGSADEAERFARQALEAYGIRNRRVHVLAHDVAYFWMERGHFARALPIFQAVLPLMQRPIERLFVAADIARAAGGVGDHATAEASAAEVWSAAVEPEIEPGAARALLEVARGYVSLDQTERARSAAERALALASKHRESRVRFAAEALIDSLGTRPETTIEEEVPSPLAQPNPDSGDQLAADLVRTLEVIAGEAP
ncbi:MAG: tetratricopeptide repeat protein [Gemmatimonas sp.]|nr:tetratricopeptide repeat protein [Gemmatimonas sp.]